MEHNKYVSFLKSLDDFIEIRECIKEDLYAFVSGERCNLSDNMTPEKTSAQLVCNYLNIFVEETLITNKQINNALSKIDVRKNENVWLLLDYIEQQKCKERFDFYKVKIDVPMIEKMLEKADPALKDDYTVKYIKRETKEKYGYDIKF